jgi:8-oxo-dGTP diphosphatase
MTVPCGVATLICTPFPKELMLECPCTSLTYMENNILLGLRKGAHGAGTWSLPGGRIEPGESPKAAAEREVLEETGLKVDVEVFRPVPFNNVIAGGQPWVTLYFITWVENAEPQVMEPEKCEQWKWFNGYMIPALNLFEPFAALVEETRKLRGRHV